MAQKYKIVTQGPGLLVREPIATKRRGEVISIKPGGMDGFLEDGEVVTVTGVLECKAWGFTEWLIIDIVKDNKPASGLIASMYAKPLEG
jgi:hypothetical protein